MVHIKNNAFTLVELIVVIVILSILATIAFLSFSSQSGSARDSDRLADTANISKGLGIFNATSGSLPMPDGYLTVMAGTGYSVYQGTAGTRVLSMVKLSDAKDNLDSNYYSYSLDQNKTHYTIGGYLENPTGFNAINPFWGFKEEQANALDYSKRYLFTRGDTLGIITESGSNGTQPIEQLNPAGTTIDLSVTPKILVLNTSKTASVAGSGQIIGTIQTIENGNLNFNAPASCPTGFIPVPGNAEFNQPGFCVMKYEAKALSGIVNSGYNGHNYSTSDVIVSNATDVPIVYISETGSIAACQSLGSGYHLVTNNEWMTIARNVEQQSADWSGNAIGSGYIFSGHSDSLPYTALSASTDDSQGYYLETNTGGNQKRTLILSNKQVIWDFAGNVWEQVNKANTIDGSNMNLGQTSVSGCSPATSAAEWTSCSDRAFASMGNYNSSNGIGQVWYSQGVSNNVFARGGTFYSGVMSGIYSLSISGISSSSSWHIGFRCAK